MKIVVGLIIGLITNQILYSFNITQNKQKVAHELELIVRFPQKKSIMDIAFDSNNDIYLLTMEPDTSVSVSPLSSYSPTIYKLIKIFYLTNEIVVLDSNYPVVREILLDNEDNIWAFKYNTLYFGYGDNLKTIISDGNFSFISVDHENNIWAGSISTNSYGLYKIDDEFNITLFNVENSKLHTNTISDLHVDKYNNLWLALGDNNGILKISNDNWDYYNSENSKIPSSFVIMSLVSDQNDNIWIAGHDDKEMFIMMYNGSKWIKKNKYQGNKEFISVDNIYACNRKIFAISSETYKFGARLSSKVLSFNGKSWENDIIVPTGRSIWNISINSETNSLILNARVELYKLTLK